MPVSPLFVGDLPTLRSALRLSGSSQLDTSALLDRIIEEVRLGFFSRLTSFRVNQILATALVPNPTTQEQLDRLKASNTEILWTKARLLLELPVLFMDSSGQTSQVWNEETLTRDASRGDAKALSDTLMEIVNDALDDLSGDEEEGMARVFVIGPTESQPVPGGSAWRS